MSKLKCRICKSDDDDWWCSTYIFGVLCQDCRLKHTVRLMEVARKAADKEIKKIKKENEDA